jgi:hypothetical protein
VTQDNENHFRACVTTTGDRENVAFKRCPDIRSSYRKLDKDDT